MQSSIQTPPAQIRHLRGLVSGEVIVSGDPGYDEARSVYYSGLVTQPAAIVRPRDARDVSRVVSYARESGAPLAVRSGGHSPAGHSGVDDGIVLDLSSLNSIEVSVKDRTAWADAGMTAGALTRATGAHGLVVGFGDTASVGIGGITLGGGIGFLHRKLGLTIDSVLGAEIVTADGEVRRIDAESEPDLFWAIRGGGGNFGVVTRIHYRLHEVGEAMAGMIALPANPRAIVDALEALQAASEDLSGFLNVMLAPPMPFLPAEVHGKPIISALLVNVGDADAGARALAPLRAIATPVLDQFRSIPYSQVYEGGPEPPSPARVASTCFFTDEVDLAAAEAILEALPRSRAPMRVAHFRVMGGAVARVPADATAFAHRNRAIMVLTGAMYGDPAEEGEHQQWTKELADHLRKGERGAYIGFMGSEGEARVRDAYPDGTWERLRAIKARFDPTNLFRRNQNVPPA